MEIAKNHSSESLDTDNAEQLLQGLFITTEGGDGSGKGTQSNLLVNDFEKAGCDVLKVSFPRHGMDSAIYVDKYLNGEYGEADDVPADLASLPYALDRFKASGEIREHLAKPNSVVIADRYVASNLAHQGTKFDNAADRREYYERNMKTEYELFGIPKPDLNIVLKVPTDIAQTNVDKKDISVHSYTDKKRDIHEANASHLNRANANYSELCELYPDEFVSIDCTENGEMRTIDDIHSEILFVINSFRKIFDLNK